MKKGFTLIELLVVMVIIALLVGLLLPALARAKEEARKTQCRSNLRQIGYAIQMYSNDNGGYWPVMGGGTYGTYSNTFVTHTRGDYFPSTLATVANPQPWHCSPARPARPIGLGLLWAGGYLTSKGAQVLYCPSNNSGNYSDEIGSHMVIEYDSDDPFWTSQGLIVRSDNDSHGNTTTSGDKDIDRWYNHCADNYTDKYAGNSNIDTDYCRVAMNYTMRVTKYGDPPIAASRNLDNSAKIERLGAKVIVADNLALILDHRSARYYENAAGFNIANTNNDAEKAAYDARRSDIMVDAKKYLVTNHDSSYILLYTDGSVKTFTDGSNNVLWAFITGVHRFSNNSTTWTMPGAGGAYDTNDALGRGAAALEHAVFIPLLDGAYRAD